MQKLPYFFALFVWISLAFLSACSPPKDSPQNVKLASISHFSGASHLETHKLSPLSAICFDDAGVLYTLVQDSGRITAYDATGAEKASSALGNLANKRSYSIEAIALGLKGDRIFVLDGKNAQIQEWKKDGQFIRTTPVAIPLSPGDTAFGNKSMFYHNTEGLADDSLIVAFDTGGKRTQRLGVIPATDTLLTSHKSLRRSLAKGDVPGFMKNSVLIAAGNNNRVYAVHRTKPVLKCFEYGRLRYKRNLNFPELDDIRAAAEIRNRLLKASGSYIPFSYWSDIAVDDKGDIYLLLALQSRHTIYRLDSEGNFIQKINGDYGKGHLLTVQNNLLAVADAAKRLVTIYEMAGIP